MVRVFTLGTSTLDTSLIGATVIADTDFFDAFYPGVEAVSVTKLTAAAFFNISSTLNSFHTSTDDGTTYIDYKVVSGAATTWITTTATPPPK